MANPEHLEILKQGVEVWNEWRNRNYSTRPDLKEADLNGVILHRTDLSRENRSRTHLGGVDLSGADLSGASLLGAELSGAELAAAKLVEAKLVEAKLIAADLGGADLSGADLSRANLSAADLSRANLNGANLTETRCLFTFFIDVDLQEVIGLETVHHLGSSTIGIDTLYRSKGKIPEVFLRGCGVPEKLITFLPSLLEEAIQFYSCFISYSHADKDFARRLHDRLQGEGIRCWLD